MTETLGQMQSARVGRDGVTAVSFYVSIAPAPPNANTAWLLISESKRPGDLHIRYDYGTIERASAATIVHREWSGEDLAHVRTEIRYWDEGRWVTDDEYLRRRYPREMAEFDKLLAVLRGPSSTQSSTRPAAPSTRP